MSNFRLAPVNKLRLAAALGAAGSIAASGPPYELPAAGAAKLIAPADGHLAVNPGQLSNNSFTYSTFGSYGSGDYNPYWSPTGAYMLAGTGGHNHPETFGCLYFDFEPSTFGWGYIPAVGQADRGPVNEDTETNGPPWYEMTGTEIPAPPHPYANQVVLPPSLGGGAKGALMYPSRSALGIGAKGSPGAHKFALPSGVWSRAAALPAQYATGFPVYDSLLGRWYMIPSQPWSFNKVEYIGYDVGLEELVWATIDGTGFSYNAGNAGDGLNAFLHGRILVAHQGTNASPSVGRFQALDLDNPTAGWSVLSVSGTLTDTIYDNVWAYHAAQGVYYRRWADARPGAGLTFPQGQTLYKLTPPATNPLVNTWTVTTVSLAGDTVPDNFGPNVGTNAYRRLFYIPPLEMLGWVTAQGVALLNPV